MYLIGIDLGTTNSTIAACKLEAGSPIIQQPIFQRLSLDKEGEESILPSALYFPLAEEKLPLTIGKFARERGKEVPERLFLSAKSWLCHPGIDRKAILGDKISPYKATVEILKHVKASWDKQNPDSPAEAQKVLITVPASFDPAARALTEEAAEEAGFKGVTLMEEPLAAFYAWLHRHEATWRETLKIGDKVLVVDVGGGTTDFTLIEVEEDAGNLTLKRVAVGAHLLLGGDNIDHLLAHLAEEKIGKELDNWQKEVLLFAARSHKEALFGENPPEKLDFTIPGRGSKLIGGALKAALSSEECRTVILEGFFPLIAKENASQPEARAGLSVVGLPYVRDPRLTAQLAKFLSMSGESQAIDAAQFVFPTHVLFNGGTFEAKPFRDRILEQLATWSGKPVQELSGSNLHTSVSEGAVAYGWVREGNKLRVKSGTSRSFYIGVEEARPAIPGVKSPCSAICVVPFGMEEGSSMELSGKVFQLSVGEPAVFRFFSRSAPLLSNGKAVEFGAELSRWKGELTELQPLEVELAKGEDQERSIPVRLKSYVSELGKLELFAMAEDGKQWKLELDLR